VIALIVVYGVLGLFFWFAFLGAVAATIDDPHNSTRGSLLFVPMFASGMAYLVLRDADSALSRTFALFPPTAPSAMPVRLMTSEVGALELILSLGLLIGAIAMLRIAAGRIFRAAMLMYGKEPSWAELRRWATGQ
jgi:ABC-2 type transport system permease protein